MIEKLLAPIRLVHLLIMIFVALVAPMITFFSYKEVVASEIASIRLEREQYFVRKDKIEKQFDKIFKKLDGIAEDVNQVKGKLEKN